MASAVGELPTGTVTLLLADVEGSTRLWETQPDEMASALGRLNEAVTELVSRHNGVRPVEQGEGDSFVVAFARRATRWHARWNCSGLRWRRSGCESACTPARFSCATRAITRDRRSTGLHACAIWATAVRPCCRARLNRWSSTGYPQCAWLTIWHARVARPATTRAGGAAVPSRSCNDYSPRCVRRKALRHRISRSSSPASSAAAFRWTMRDGCSATTGW